MTGTLHSNIHDKYTPSDTLIVVSKRSFAETQRHVRQTGGVPPPKTLDLVSEQIVDMMKNTAS
jgi:hypothetical protein